MLECWNVRVPTKSYRGNKKNVFVKIEKKIIE